MQREPEDEGTSTVQRVWIWWTWTTYLRVTSASTSCVRIVLLMFWTLRTDTLMIKQRHRPIHRTCQSSVGASRYSAWCHLYLFPKRQAMGGGEALGVGGGRVVLLQAMLDCSQVAGVADMAVVAEFDLGGRRVEVRTRLGRTGEILRTLKVGVLKMGTDVQCCTGGRSGMGCNCSMSL